MVCSLIGYVVAQSQKHIKRFCNICLTHIFVLPIWPSLIICLKLKLLWSYPFYWSPAESNLGKLD